MSSSSDIEKLFEHFGGDATGYQEIGRENEARSARTRWPLLVTLDLSQPTIPAIGQHRAARPQAQVAEALADERQDSTPKDAASVTRAKAPLFTRSHRRDIPPVAAAAQPATPRGASRFGEFDALTKVDAVAQTTPEVVRAGTAAAAEQAAVQAASVAPQSTPVAAQVAAPIAPVATQAYAAPIAAVPPAVSAVPLASVASAPPAVPFRAPPTQNIPPVQPAAQSWAHPAPASTAPAWTPTRHPTPAPAPVQAPAAPASILGKLFAPEPAAAPQHAASPTESAPLQSVFDRLRGTPAQTAAAPVSAPRAAVPAPSNSWLVNGPRRS